MIHTNQFWISIGKSLLNLGNPVNTNIHSNNTTASINFSLRPSDEDVAATKIMAPSLISKKGNCSGKRNVCNGRSRVNIYIANGLEEWTLKSHITFVVGEISLVIWGRATPLLLPPNNASLTPILSYADYRPKVRGTHEVNLRPKFLSQ